MRKHPSLFALAALFFLFAGSALAQNDGFSETSTGYNLRDISASGTFVSLSDDAVSSAVPIGFTFNFYGNNYTEAYISSNGFITFSSGQSSGCCSGDDIPDPNSPNNFVAGYWEDLNLPQGNIRYETLGSAPNREFVVGFYDNPHYNGGPQVTFEMILHEGSNNVELQYENAPSDGGTHTVGAENIDGTFGYLVARGSLTYENVGILLSPEPINLERVPSLGGVAIVLLTLLLGIVGITHFRRQSVT